MKNEDELLNQIVTITMHIREKFPELSKYLTEMPITIPSVKRPKMGSRELQDYIDSLEELLLKYAPNHDIDFKKEGKKSLGT